MDDLSTYLDDHRAGAAAGEQVAKRLADTNRHQPWAAELESIAVQVSADVRTLDDVRNRLGIAGGAGKYLLAAAGGYLARWRPDRTLLHSEALTRVLDLEAMISGVAGKRQLWDVLDRLPPDERLDDFDFAGLVDRADQQIATLRSVHRAAADGLRLSRP